MSKKKKKPRAGKSITARVKTAASKSPSSFPTRSKMLTADERRMLIRGEL